MVIIDSFGKDENFESFKSTLRTKYKFWNYTFRNMFEFLEISGEESSTPFEIGHLGRLRPKLDCSAWATGCLQVNWPELH